MACIFLFILNKLTPVLYCNDYLTAHNCKCDSELSEREFCDLLVRHKVRRRVGRNLDKSADKDVDVQVTSQLSSAQR